MESSDPVLVVVDALNALNVPYMLVGSYSSNLYGIPRSTRDADFVVEMENSAITNVARRLAGEFKLDPQMGFETVTFHSRWVFDHLHSDFKLEMFLLSDHPFDRQRFARRHRHSLQGRDVWIQTAEDVIINKLRWGRLKDLPDALNVMRVQEDALDWVYIEAWCTRFDRMALLNELRNEH